MRNFMEDDQGNARVKTQRGASEENSMDLNKEDNTVASERRDA